MKKILLVGIPVGLLILVLVVAQSFGFGRGFRGGHHQGMARDFLKWKLERLSGELDLSPAQRAKWDTFQRDLEAKIDSRQDKRKDIHEAIRTELSKENPDPGKVTPLIHNQIDEMAQFGHDLVNRIGELYTDLTPEQKQKLSQEIERFHERHEE